MTTNVTPPLSLTILRQGERLFVDLAEVGTLIPRGETRVEDAFLRDKDLSQKPNRSLPPLSKVTWPLRLPPYRRPWPSKSQPWALLSTVTRKLKSLNKPGRPTSYSFRWRLTATMIAESDLPWRRSLSKQG